MKHLKFITILLLFFISITLISCNNAQAMFDKGSYEEALFALNSKRVLSKNNHLLKIKTLVNLGRSSEARESTLLYLLMADSGDERTLPVQLFTELGYSDALNILILKPSDGVKAQTVLFKSYFNMGQYENAFNLLNDYMSSGLSISQYLRILIDYPCNIPFTFEIFDSWYDLLTTEEIDEYLSLFSEFVKLNISEETASECLQLISSMENNEMFNSNNKILSEVYKIKSDICYILHDYFNGNLYYQQFLKLRPGNSTFKQKIK